MVKTAIVKSVGKVLVTAGLRRTRETYKYATKVGNPLSFFGGSVLEHKGVGVLRGEFESAPPNISPWCNGSTKLNHKKLIGKSLG